MWCCVEISRCQSASKLPRSSEAVCTRHEGVHGSGLTRCGLGLVCVWQADKAVRSAKKEEKAAKLEAKKTAVRVHHPHCRDTTRVQMHFVKRLASGCL